MPTRKRKRTRPMLAVRVRFGMESLGKMVVVNFGIWPMTEGPRMTPPMTSAITRGWRIRERNRARSCVMPMMTTVRGSYQRPCGDANRGENKLTKLNDPDAEGVGLVVHCGIVSGEYASLGVVSQVARPDI